MELLFCEVGAFERLADVLRDTVDRIAVDEQIVEHLCVRLEVLTKLASAQESGVVGFPLDRTPQVRGKTIGSGVRLKVQAVHAFVTAVQLLLHVCSSAGSAHRDLVTDEKAVHALDNSAPPLDRLTVPVILLQQTAREKNSRSCQRRWSC